MASKVTRLASVRAGLALMMARELARSVSLDDRGHLHGTPVVLAALCRYVGAGVRGCQNGSVWMAEKYRTRIRLLGVRVVTAPARLAGAA